MWPRENELRERIPVPRLLSLVFAYSEIVKIKHCEINAVIGDKLKFFEYNRGNKNYLHRAVIKEKKRSCQNEYIFMEQFTSR